jgi:hypothetical protein
MNPVLQDAMGTKLTKLKIFLERNELFSTRLPTQSMTCAQRRTIVTRLQEEITAVHRNYESY